MIEIPVYFPMTYLSAVAGRLLSACFDRIVVLRPGTGVLPDPMQAAADQGRLAVRIPVEKESRRLLQLRDEYQAWAEMNRGTDLSFFKGREAGIPFFNDQSISRIRQDIRDMESKDSRSPSVDPVFRARLFLEMAQELDRRNSELDRSLGDLRARENKMMADLLGEDEVLPGTGPASRPGSLFKPGAHMTASRILAWWQMARAGQEIGNLLVTESREVIDYLVENGTGLAETGLAGCIPGRHAGKQTAAGWQEAFLASLQKMAVNPEARIREPDFPDVEPGETTVNITVYRSNSGDASMVFNALANSATPPTGRNNGQRLVVCLVTPAMS